MKESFNKILKAGIVAGAITIPIESIADSIKDSNINNPPKEPTEQVGENIDSLNITPEQDYQAKLAEWERAQAKYVEDSTLYNSRMEEYEKSLLNKEEIVDTFDKEGYEKAKKEYEKAIVTFNKFKEKYLNMETLFEGESIVGDNWEVLTMLPNDALQGCKNFDDYFKNSNKGVTVYYNDYKIKYEPLRISTPKEYLNYCKGKSQYGMWEVGVYAYKKNKIEMDKEKILLIFPSNQDLPEEIKTISSNYFDKNYENLFIKERPAYFKKKSITNNKYNFFSADFRTVNNTSIFSLNDIYSSSTGEVFETKDNIWCCATSVHKSFSDNKLSDESIKEINEYKGTNIEKINHSDVVVRYNFQLLHGNREEIIQKLLPLIKGTEIRFALIADAKLYNINHKSFFSKQEVQGDLFAVQSNIVPFPIIPSEPKIEDFKNKEKKITKGITKDKPELPVKTLTPKPPTPSLHFKPASLAATRFKIGDSGNLESHLPYNINTVIGTIVNEKGKTTEMTVKDYIELTKGKTEEQKAQMFGVSMDWWDEMIRKMDKK